MVLSEYPWSRSRRSVPFDILFRHFVNKSLADGLDEVATSRAVDFRRFHLATILHRFDELAELSQKASATIGRRLFFELDAGCFGGCLRYELKRHALALMLRVGCVLARVFEDLLLAAVIVAQLIATLRVQNLLAIDHHKAITDATIARVENRIPSLSCSATRESSVISYCYKNNLTPI